MIKVACLCPTYKRPRHLANALACFLAQNYDPRGCRLFILDDAMCTDGSDRVQHVAQTGKNWELHTSDTRFKTLPEKYNRLIRIASAWQPDMYAVWEDDDVFLPWHVQNIAIAGHLGMDFYRTQKVYSNYNEKMGNIHLEDASGRFHSSWAFSATLVKQMGGYPKTDRLDFDQQLHSIAASLSKNPPLQPPGYWPGYVYRWGNGVYHGSASGEAGYKALCERLERMEAPFVGEIEPEFDEETKVLIQVRPGHIGNSWPR
jgi:hypothetical protein